MKLDVVTRAARGLARQSHRRLCSDRSSQLFRVLSTAWRALRCCHLRLLRRQPPLLLVLDRPPRLNGFGAITGWAISRDASVTQIEAEVGGRVIAATPPTERRDDIFARFPHYRSHGSQGFRLAPPPGLLTGGEHPLVLRARDARGRTAELRRTLHVENYRLADNGELPGHLQGTNREYQVWRLAHAQAPSVPPSAREARGSWMDSGSWVPPRISVVIPLFRPDPEHLRAAVESVRGQHFQNWELWLCDDGSGQAELTRYLEELAAMDERIHWTSHASNRGIAAATNTAIGLATGDYIAFLDQDDELAPEALAAIAAAVESQPAEVLYSDWDRIDPQGCYVEPFFKPDWSPDLLQSMMYLAHLTVYRREFLHRIGLCWSEFDGAQDWELALRATRHTDLIVHIPRVLYHWRIGGVSAGAAFNRVCHERGRRALLEHVRHQEHPGIDCVVEDGPTPCTFHVRYRHERWPLVSILIPTRHNRQLLRRCLRSIRQRTDYPHYEILIIDNGSQHWRTQRFLRRCGERVVRLDEPFNHSRLNNVAARLARGELLVLLNDDTEVINRDWLHALAEQALRPQVAAVGAWLFHADERTQHAGIVLGLGPVATPLHSGILRDGVDRGTARLIRNVSAVSGACLMIRKELYLEMGGFDERSLPTSFNDVDLCLRLRRAGYHIVQQPLARLFHHESATRRIGDESAFVRFMRESWGAQLNHDPFWNPNLSRQPGGGFAFNWQVPPPNPAFGGTGFQPVRGVRQTGWKPIPK